MSGKMEGWVGCKVSGSLYAPGYICCVPPKLVDLKCKLCGHVWRVWSNWPNTDRCPPCGGELEPTGEPAGTPVQEVDDEEWKNAADPGEDCTGCAHWETNGQFCGKFSGGCDGPRRQRDPVEEERVMRSYRVIWEIAIEADSPQEAAQEALKIHRDPESVATHFEVYGERGVTSTWVFDVFRDGEVVNEWSRSEPLWGGFVDETG